MDGNGRGYCAVHPFNRLVVNTPRRRPMRPDTVECPPREVSRQRITLFLTLVLCSLSSQSSAEFVTLTYTEQAIQWNSTLDLIAQTRGLSGPDAFATKQIAATWVYLGPCRGSANDLENAGDGAMRFVLGANPTVPFDGAVLEMIGALGRDNLGRQPTPDLCRFARDIAPRVGRGRK